MQSHGAAYIHPFYHPSRCHASVLNYITVLGVYLGGFFIVTLKVLFPLFLLFRFGVNSARYNTHASENLVLHFWLVHFHFFYSEILLSEVTDHISSTPVNNQLPKGLTGSLLRITEWTPGRYTSHDGLTPWSYANIRKKWFISILVQYLFVLFIFFQLPLSSFSVLLGLLFLSFLIFSFSLFLWLVICLN